MEINTKLQFFKQMAIFTTQDTNSSLGETTLPLGFLLNIYYTFIEQGQWINRNAKSLRSKDALWTNTVLSIQNDHTLAALRFLIQSKRYPPRALLEAFYWQLYQVINRTECLEQLLQSHTTQRFIVES